MTASSEKLKRDPKDYTFWLRFDDGSAQLKLVIAPSGQKYILLMVKDQEKMAFFQDKAASCGLVQSGDRPQFRALIGENRHPPVPLAKMAPILGARAIALKKTDLAGPDYTIRLNPRQGKSVDTSKFQTIGLNAMGYQVLTDPEGARYIRRSTGESEFRKYQEGRDLPAAFLIAKTERDLDTISAGLFEMASRGTLHMGDFDRMMSAALEHWDEEETGINLDAARRRAVISMGRQISDLALDDRRSTDNVQKALRIASFVGFVSSRVLESDEGFSPSPAMSIFLRRIIRDATSVDLRGNDALAAALPRMKSAEAAHQVHDMTGMAESMLPDQITNILARRPASGSTVLILNGTSEDAHIEDLRNSVGLTFAIEAMAEVTSSVATGIQDQPPKILMMVGMRRPEPLEVLPLATLRTFSVVSQDDLRTLERETLRSRLRIRDFHRGIIEERVKEADERSENIRQRPYQSLSRVSEPFTMVPIALEGATTMALDRVRRDFESKGGVDAAVSFSLGLSLDELPDRLTAEQVDAVALRLHAASRNRGFLVADQTGIGKGRTLAAIAAQEMRQNRKRVLYFTESAIINVRDVTRDLLGVGVNIVDAQSRAIQDGETKVCFLTTGSLFEFERRDQATGEMMPDRITSLPSAEHKRTFHEGIWPKDADVVITTYTQFNFKEGNSKAPFLDLIDENTLLVFDEAHNALNPKSNVGRNLRKLIAQAGPENTVFGTATFARSAMGLDLYRSLLPQSIENDFFESLQEGGEIALESFSTMLAQDGVLIRRDHDLSSIDFMVSIPDDDQMAGYQEVMDKFSPVVEMMIDASTIVGEHIGRASAMQFRAARASGMSQQAARAVSNEMNQYSIGIGAPLSMIARLAMNAIRIDQLVDVTVEEIEEGRKPLITFHSTSEAILKEFCRDENGRVSEALMNGSENLTFRDQIHRIHESVYKVKIDGEKQDARLLYPDVAEAFERVRDRINELPSDLPVSPIDALMERLEAHGYTVGEISGRSLCYRDSRIQKRTNRDRSEIIDSFNNGDTDILIYNGAGATGGSYHAAPNVRDQRPRTMLEFEPPLDPIKYIQGLGRGNRYGQVAKPRVRSVVTGLTPEMRIMQQRNNKLRMLGASIDGSRAHPMLLDDVPDLLNRVGDAAARNVLLSMPSMARRLGFPEYAEENRDAEEVIGNEGVDEGVGDTKAENSLANKVLSRSLSLSAKDQNDLVQRIVVEFDALIEELDSRNANPLRPKQLDGEIRIMDTDLFAGEERAQDDLDVSAFTSPLYLKTGIHIFNEAAWTGEKVMTEIESNMRLYGADGLMPWSDRIAQNLPNLLRPHLPEGMRIEEALENPAAAGRRFEQRHGKLTDLAWLLENIKPGVALRFPSEWDEFAEIRRVIVEVQPPRHASMFDTPAAYRIKTIAAGDTKLEVTSLSRIMSINKDLIYFSPGLSEGVDERFMNAFDRQALLTRQMPVQILSGNILSSIQEARKHNLGTISLYRDEEARVHRGIVVSRNKVNLASLPVQVANGVIAREAIIAYHQMEQPPTELVKIYVSMLPETEATRSADADGIITIQKTQASIDFIALRKSNYDFFAERPGLYEAIYGKELPSREEVRARTARNASHKPILISWRNDPPQRERFYHILTLLGDAHMITGGAMRGILNTATTMVNRLTEAGQMPNYAMPGITTPEQDEAEVPEAMDAQEYPGDEDIDAENLRFEI